MSSVVQYIEQEKLKKLLDQLLQVTDTIIIADIPGTSQYLDAVSTLINVFKEKNFKLFLRLIYFYTMLFISNSGNSIKYEYKKKFFSDFSLERKLKIKEIENIGLGNYRKSFEIKHD